MDVLLHGAILLAVVENGGLEHLVIWIVYITAAQHGQRNLPPPHQWGPRRYQDDDH